MIGTDPAPVKKCSMCGETKVETDFHRMGARGRHSYCKPCIALRPRKRKRYDRTEQNLLVRYGITSADRDAMLEQQGGVCAICKTEPRRAVVDHCHASGAVRGVLCHACNVKLSAIEDRGFRLSAMRYLGVANHEE